MLQLHSINEDVWNRHVQPIATLSRQQDWAYGDALKLIGRDVFRFSICDSDSTPLAVAQVVERKLVSGWGVVSLMRGPVWLAPRSPKLESQIIATIRARFRHSAMLFMPEQETMGELEPIPSLHRVMTGYSTVMVDLRRPLNQLRLDLHGKWRNMLKASERQSLSIKHRSHGYYTDWLMKQCEQQRKKKGYKDAPTAFFQALNVASRKNKRQQSLIAFYEQNPIAGITIQKHGKNASYLLSYTSADGRKRRAHHRLLWQAIELLKAQGIEQLDLGGVETVQSPNLARFKLGLGGRVLTLAGTYFSFPAAFSLIR